jgi:hypothetical protein
VSDNDYTEQQYQALKYGNEQFDKNVLFIASGALGISFAFIEKIIPDLKQAVSKELLIYSWYCFAGVIFISLLAHFISILANRWAIANNEETCKHYQRRVRTWNYSIRSINILMIVSLLYGMVQLIRFINLNIN